MEIDGLTRVARYERTLGVSLERVWENVLDWEHLPWLHRSSFRSIDCRESGAWGWRARIGLPRGRGEVLTELLVERDQLRYVARTLEGSGRGTEVWTLLEPRAAGCTAISVEFHLPGPAPERAEAIGEAYLELYARLWDEDEGMMSRRAELLASPAPAAAQPVASLGPRAELLASLPRVVSWCGRRFRLVALEGDIVAHAAVCPHRLGPLEEAPTEDGCVVCPWHGYRFDLRSGRSSDGRGLYLPTAPRVVVDPETREVQLEAG